MLFSKVIPKYRKNRKIFQKNHKKMSDLHRQDIPMRKTNKFFLEHSIIIISYAERFALYALYY